MSAYLKRPILSHKRDVACLLYIIWNVTEHHHSNFVTTDQVCIRTQPLTSVLCVGMHVQVVKLSLKRTVWGVVTSATASSCPSDKPSSGKREGNPLEDLMNVSSYRWKSSLIPFKVLQRFGLVRSSIDLTDWNEIVTRV